MSDSGKIQTKRSNASPSSATISPRVRSLSRGEACINCRRRHMKCDGERPHCGPCTQAHVSGRCEYDDNRTLRCLKNEIERLRERVRELECQLQQCSAPAATDSPLREDDGSSDANSNTPAVAGDEMYHPRPVRAQELSYNGAYEHDQRDELPSAQDLIDESIALTGDRLLPFFLNIASSHFSLPPCGIRELASLSPAPALVEAACAAACVFVYPNHNMAKFEAIFLERASLALAQHGQDYDIHVAQALVVLAVLAFVGGNFNSGRGHLQAALAAAHALQLATDEDSLDTVLMIHHVERAWSPITGFAHLDLHAFPSLERYTETSMLHEVRLAFTGVQLTARAWTVISSAAYGPRPDASSIIIALDELAPATRSPSARLVISIARFLLQHSVAAWDRSLDAAAGGMAIPTECQQLARMDPVVGWWLAQLNEFLLRTASPHTLSLSREVALAVAHARSMWPYVIIPRH